MKRNTFLHPFVTHEIVVETRIHPIGKMDLSVGQQLLRAP